MEIELPSDLADHIADLCDVWGAGKRPGFVADIEDRIRRSVANEKMISGQQGGEAGQLSYVADKYRELLCAVATKHPGETRHETALRYIQQAENRPAYCEAAAAPDEADECASCGEGMPKGECPNSQRPCGHHCNHSWDQDICHWCGKEFGEDAAPEPEGRGE